MPSPSTSVASLRNDLADSLREFSLDMNMAGFVGNQVLPIVDVASAAGNFGIIPVEQLLKPQNTRRSAGSRYNRGDFTFQTSTYSTEEHGEEEPVDDNQSKMYREYFDAEVIATSRARHAVLANYEKRVADLVFNTTTWSGASLTTSITNEWDDYTNATPIADVEAASKKVFDGTGMYPNALVINRTVFRNLRNCSQVVDRITAAGAGEAAKASDVTAAMLAMVFDFDYVIVAGGAVNSAIEGAAASISNVWSNEYAMVCRVATGNDFAEPCIGRTFHWGEDGSIIGGTVESYREEQSRSNIIRCRFQSDEVILYAAMGHLLSNITT
jgi:hypothetical protein